MHYFAIELAMRIVSFFCLKAKAIFHLDTLLSFKLIPNYIYDLLTESVDPFWIAKLLKVIYNCDKRVLGENR